MNGRHADPPPHTHDNRTEAAVMPAALGPVTASERIVELDVLRGIALLGVVIANVWLWFSGITFLFPGIRDELVRLSVDGVVFNGIGVLVAGKAMATFSFLFGLGFAVQMLRAEGRDIAMAPVYLRRLAVLLLFGAVHGFLLWYGDILMLYAVLGVVLLLVRRFTDRTLIVGAALLLVAVPLALGAVPLIMGVFGSSPPAPDLAVIAEGNAATLAAFRSGAPAQVFPANLEMLRYMYLSPQAIGWSATTLGLFLLGLCAGRRRIFENVAMHRASFTRVAIWGLATGLVFSAGVAVMYVGHPPEAIAAQPWLALLMAALVTFGTVPLALGYIATATLLLQRPAWQRRLGPFAPVGRMALTNYLAQTILCLLIFYGYGAGLIGRVGSAVALAIALLVFALQGAWSPWWLARYRFGPAEWLWRSLTYGRFQPMRIREPVPVPTVPSALGGAE
jgi:uncharacterized protein